MSEQLSRHNENMISLKSFSWQVILIQGICLILGMQGFSEKGRLPYEPLPNIYLCFLTDK